MKNFKIERFFNLNEPELWIESQNKEWNIIITQDEVKIEHDWDHGWGGRGTERFSIPREEFKKLLEEFDKKK